LKDYWTSESYVPKSSSTQGSANLYGNSLYYRSYTQQYGGYYVSKPNVSFETRLFDRKSGEVAWLVSSTTRGNAFADYGNLASSLAKKVVSELKKEEMLVFSPTEMKAKETSGTLTSKREMLPEKDNNQPPVIEFIAEPRTGNAPLEVSFDASASDDPDGRIETYQWDFKDGSKGNGGVIQHTFNSSGFYNVELTATDDEGAESTIAIMIIVSS
jgi:PKD repeat protein